MNDVNNLCTSRFTVVCCFKGYHG